MSSDISTTRQPAPGFVWILGALASFALLSLLAQSYFGQDHEADSHGPDRLANLTEVKAAQAANVKKMGLEMGNSSERLAKSLEALKSLTPSTSTMLVPGSPTQLKQAAAPAPAAAPAAAPAPAK